MVYFHGCYWQRMDKKDLSFLAQPFVDNGITFVNVNYTLAPLRRSMRSWPNPDQHVPGSGTTSPRLKVAVRTSTFQGLPQEDTLR